MTVPKDMCQGLNERQVCTGALSAGGSAVESEEGRERRGEGQLSGGQCWKAHFGE